jgi:hypothetical protein
MIILKKQSHKVKHFLHTKVNYWLHKKKKQLIFGVPDTMIRLYSSFGESGTLRSTTGRLSYSKWTVQQYFFDP